MLYPQCSPSNLIRNALGNSKCSRRADRMDVTSSRDSSSGTPSGQPFPGGILNVQWLEKLPDVHQQAELQELKLGR